MNVGMGLKGYAAKHVGDADSAPAPVDSPSGSNAFVFYCSHIGWRSLGHEYQNKVTGTLHMF